MKQYNSVTPMELDQAKTKLEDSVRTVDNSMEQVLQQEVDRTAQIKNLIDSQAAYFERSAEIMKQLRFGEK